MYSKIKVQDKIKHQTDDPPNINPVLVCILTLHPPVLTLMLPHHILPFIQITPHCNEPPYRSQAKQPPHVSQARS